MFLEPADLTEVDIQNGSLFIDNPETSKAFSILPDGAVAVINKNEPNVPTNAGAPVPVPIRRR